jgi:site-specific DNA recombinase
MEKKTKHQGSRLNKYAKGKKTPAIESQQKNCVIYTRVSSKEQMDNNQSLEWQKKFCYEYALKQQFLIKGYFGGTYESAKSDARKEFNRMLKFVKASKEKITHILVYSLDRFSRTGDSAIYIASELKKTGVTILAVTQPIDTNSHAGSLQQNIQFIFSKYDNDLRRQKTVDGMKEKLLRGEWLGHCPTGYAYDPSSSGRCQKINITKDGPAVRQAFEWKLQGFNNREICRKLKLLGLEISFQVLTRMFQNPFYCGYLSHNLLEGQIVKGNHVSLVSEELFHKVNGLKVRGGYYQKKENECLPLKGFVREHKTGAPFTGYLVKKKGLYYYKANKIGVKLNRSMAIMHEKFKELLKMFTLDNDWKDAFKELLKHTFEKINTGRTDVKKNLACELKDIQAKIDSLEKRYAFGEISPEIFGKFSGDLYAEKKRISEELEKLDQELSNPENLINFATSIATKLSPAWLSGDFGQKRRLQNLLFPDGLTYDPQIEHYRTTRVNSVFAVIPRLSRDSGVQNKNTPENFSEVSSLVAGDGFEPTTFGL